MSVMSVISLLYSHACTRLRARADGLRDSYEGPKEGLGLSVKGDGGSTTSPTSPPRHRLRPPLAAVGRRAALLPSVALARREGGRIGSPTVASELQHKSRPINARYTRRAALRSSAVAVDVDSHSL